MKFEKLHETIPYAIGGKVKVLRMSPYDWIELSMPGRHAKDTDPKGGDFCVEVSDLDSPLLWVDHQFTHTDLFKDVEEKYEADITLTELLMGCYYEIVANGEDPEPMIVPGGERLPGLNYKTFLYAVQCLAVAEHRRYGQHEKRFGGRFLPFRFSAGIAEGLWDAATASDKSRRGRPGVEWLEKDYGRPEYTDWLLNGRP